MHLASCRCFAFFAKPWLSLRTAAADLFCMAHRRAVALAGAVCFSAMSAVLAIGANFGLFGLAAHQDAGVGMFQPAAATEPEPATPANRSERAPSQAVQLPAVAP